MRRTKVHIIESPSPKDFFNTRQEGVTLKAALDYAGVPATLRTVVNLHNFAHALVEVMQTHEEGSYPIVHLSMHGNETGICLTSNEVFAWKALGGGLCDVNAALGGMLLLSMSTCFGLSGIEMAHRPEGEPFFALVGPKKKIAWGDTVAPFTSFYHHVVVRECPIVSGVQVMNHVLNEDLFDCKRADEVKKEWAATKLIDDRLRRIAERLSKSTNPGVQERSAELLSLLTGKK